MVKAKVKQISKECLEFEKCTRSFVHLLCVAIVSKKVPDLLHEMARVARGFLLEVCSQCWEKSKDLQRKAPNILTDPSQYRQSRQIEKVAIPFNNK